MGLRRFLCLGVAALLLEEAVALDSPVVDLCAVLSMHLGTRRLQKAKALSRVVKPGRSMLAGCSYSILLTRLYLKRPLTGVVDACPATKLGVYVDGIGQFQAGGLLDMRARIVDAAVRLVGVDIQLRLNNSSKTVVVSSDPGTARVLKQTRWLNWGGHDPHT